MKKINHKKLFVLALRTAIVIVISFFIYEIIVNLEKILDKNMYNNKLSNEFVKRFTHFFTIFISDLVILYLIVILFDINL